MINVPDLPSHLGNPGGAEGNPKEERVDIRHERLVNGDLYKVSTKFFHGKGIGSSRWQRLSTRACLFFKCVRESSTEYAGYVDREAYSDLFERTYI